ncbi:hypothetical protein CSUI_000361 [Cystoisospora suis]|uniref:Uncharacterized protein n=1 Tax=Cystoisospora suis TaxID=483139 RepID=A0A2C6L188_9APIC|nr:hypothetical protein CSUI_000361 [Cystoisospora suis]
MNELGERLSARSRGGGRVETHRRSRDRQKRREGAYTDL